MSETASIVQEQDTSDDFAQIITISQIIDGEYKCHCGADAVLVVDTAPDNEPGATCYAHAWTWVAMATNLIVRLYGPKGQAA